LFELDGRGDADGAGAGARSWHESSLSSAWMKRVRTTSTSTSSYPLIFEKVYESFVETSLVLLIADMTSPSLKFY
jgi:hypothetical protein